jgi:hypothetical protein
MRNRECGIGLVLKGLLAVFLLSGVACSAGRIEGGVFYSAKGYRVAIPGQAWQVVADGGGDLELRRIEPKGGGPEGGRGMNAGILVNATCEGNAPRRTLPVLARHLTFGIEDRQLLERDEAAIGGRTAFRSLIRGRLDGAPVQVEAYVMKDERCVYDFLYVAPPEEFAAGVGEFRAFVGSFRGP